MSDEIYRKVAQVLNTLPNGFPPTPDGKEIAIVKKIFTEEEAALFCDMRLTFETAQEVSERCARPLSGLEDKLVAMCKRGELMGKSVNGVKKFRLMPWIFGLYEFHLPRLDREFCELCRDYAPYFGAQFFRYGPQFMHVVPVPEKIPAAQQALPYQQVSAIIENGKRFFLNHCICKKDHALLGEPCSKPTEVCLAIATEENTEYINEYSREISKPDAYRLLDQTEDAGLVHLTFNVEKDQFFICNCCGCCCGMLSAIKVLGTNRFVNSHYRAEIDSSLCTGCGRCKEERCQVNAIDEGDTYTVAQDRCIGCGLCATTCPTDAITLVRKPESEIAAPPPDEQAWYDQRARRRKVDYGKYR